MSRLAAIFAVILLVGCGRDDDGNERKKDRTDTPNAAAVRGFEWGNFPAPDIAGKDTRGDAFSIRAHKGKVVMLDFWATWCGPCVAMIPHEMQLVERLNKEGKPFVLLGISADHELEALTEFEKAQKLLWRNLLARPNSVPAEYQIEAFPTIILIDHEGIVRYRFVGRPDAEEGVDAAVAVLLEKATKK